MPPNGISSYRVSVIGNNHMVVSGHYLAAIAGYRILEAGGNAIDAGVASGIAINVLLPERTSFAGVAPILIYPANTKEPVSISGVGRWPRAATREYFQETYGSIPDGIARSVVPSACDAWLTALERYGTMTFEQVVGPSLDMAEEGIPPSEPLLRCREFIQQWPSTRDIFMPGGNHLQPGQVFVQKDLAGVFRKLIEVERANVVKGREGALRVARDFFYKGEIAETMVRFCQEQGGLLTMQDFAQFCVEVEPAQRGSYKDYTIYTCGAWCQGPSLIEILQILEGFDLKAMGHNSTRYLHTLIEAIKLAMADRHAYFGDPDFVDVPLEGLLSKDYAAERRKAIDPEKAWPEMPPAGDPRAHQLKVGDVSDPVGVFSGPIEDDTSYTCVVDRWGNAFSATPSDSIEKSPIVPGLGMIISARGAQTWLDPAHPSCLAPWKRPRLTPSPALSTRNGELFMPFGTPGTDMQLQAMTQMFLNIVEFGMNPQQAVEEARARSLSFPTSFWPHRYYPGHLDLEGRIDKTTGDELARLGHKVSWWKDWTMAAGGLCGIMVDRQRGILEGGADPRRESYAVGR